jgi:hypothetical protein
MPLSVVCKEKYLLGIRIEFATAANSDRKNWAEF